jgi:hypothetical protein
MGRGRGVGKKAAESRYIGAGQSVRLSWRQIDRKEGMYALVVMIMLKIEAISVTESKRNEETYREHNGIDGRDVFNFARRI